MSLPLLNPQIVYRDGKPSAVILDITVFEAMLDALDDLEDIEAVEHIMSEPLDTVSFDEYMAGVRTKLREQEQRESLHDRDSSGSEKAA